MQSARKLLKPTTSRTPSHSCSFSSKSQVKRKNACIQTDKNFLLVDELFERSPILKDKFCYDDRMQKTYATALEHINLFHRYMNEKLCDKYGESGDSNSEKHCFKFPDIPNYMPVFLMLLEKIKGQIFNPNNILNSTGDNVKTDFQVQHFNTTTSVIEFIPEPMSVSEDLVLSDQRNYNLVPENTMDYMNQVILYARKNNVTGNESILNFKTCNRDLQGDYHKFSNEDQNEGNEITNNMGGDNEDICKSKEQSYDDYYETSSKDCTNKDVVKQNKKVIIDIVKKRVQEELVTYMDKQNPVKNETQVQLVKSNFHIVNIQPQLNLLEYAQKKLERKMNHECESRPCTRGGESENQQKQYINNTVSGRKSVNIRPSTPKKVTNMFKKISQESFKKAKKVDNNRNMKMLNEESDDSVILNDEEFEKMNGCFEEPILLNKSQKTTIEYNLEKSNPLKLTGKDITKLNEKMLTTIGLFTERGDVRPGVIDILEEQKKAKAKDSRNKQFRVRRQWDVQIHLKPKKELNTSSFSSASTEKSYRSLSAADLTYDLECVKHVAHQTEYKQ